MFNRIEEVITREIRPYLSNHYGDIEVLSYENGRLHIRLLGQCKGCPSAKYTVEEIIENKLKENILDIKEVILHNDVNEDLYNFAKKILRTNK
ncbi:NifU family protein [Clostridium sp. D2Q-14]|uniref:NifU family protein n=1 Tax=Anaeromonas gelatinilytica TaxID=2683194 RepID=UPI00193C2E72|nr:NifU family protein [Anaeromonas gelatinilytica]MBS4536743.1 NifU family protein [Anaeromonas gelatinilytica]